MIDLMCKTRIGDSFDFTTSNDLQIDPFTGDLIIVTGKDLLSQLIVKTFLTEAGENQLNPSLGSNIFNLSFKLENSAYIEALLEEEIIRVLALIYGITKDSNNPDEKIFKVDSFEITNITPQSFTLNLYIVIQSNQLVQIPIGVE